MEDLALKQRRLLGRRCSAVDEVLHHARGHSADVLGDLVGDLESRGENLVGWDDLAEEIGEELVRGGIDGSGGDEVEGFAGADETGEEEAAASLHVETSSSKYKSNLCVLAHDSDIRGESHGDADSHRTAIDGRNDGLATVIHGQGGLATAVAMRIHGWPKGVHGVEVHARAEEPVGRVRGGEHDALDAGVRGEDGVRLLQRGGHGVCEAIAVPGAVEVQDDDGRHGCGGCGMVGEFEGGDGKGVVGFGELGFGGHRES